ncbi:hypothetical protein F5Y00DRAFT_267849 [Daldinia vernicosa]|uniref:uncharacterized protein n=1 Tax=Daldinia vernicosa TaxID=114800 RepID=UPI0020083B14|nr:uncharacterized protein F5Y00DRAFT_267849 [Daldinia vernicosa]KAI0851154.1 hypothetical protein F5Y00DRAFT_267849 [Daldinia vernicosa]
MSIYAIMDEALFRLFDLLTFRDYDAARRSAKDLINLSQVCKSLNLIVARLLAKYKVHPLEAGLIPYIYTILQNPDLASCETTFRLRLSDYNGLLETHHLHAFDARALSLRILPPSSYRTDLVPRQGNNVMVNARMHDGRTHLMYLLLASLPNLESFSIYNTCDTHFPLNARFPTVKHIRVVGYSDVFSSLDICHFRRHLVCLSNLEVFEAVNMVMCRGYIRLDRVHTIRLLSCRISTNGLDTAVKFCSPNLKTFVYRSGYHNLYLQRNVQSEENNGSRKWDASPWDIVATLVSSRARGSLETLEIDIREHFCHRTWGIHTHSPLANLDMLYNFINQLKCFPALRSIILTQQTLWEPWIDEIAGYNGQGSLCGEMRLIDVLPPSLESFALYDVTAKFLPCIVSFAQFVSRGMGFHNLKEFTLRPSPNFIRHLIHARSHQDNPELRFFDEHGTFCRVNPELLSCWGWIIVVLKDRGVRVDCVPEVHPLDTEDQEVLRR